MNKIKNINEFHYVRLLDLEMRLNAFGVATSSIQSIFKRSKSLLEYEQRLNQVLILIKRRV